MFRLLIPTDNVASLAMGKSARRSIKSDDPSSPSSSPYIYYHHSTSRPESYQLWSPNDFVSTRVASSLGEALRWVHMMITIIVRSELTHRKKKEKKQCIGFAQKTRKMCKRENVSVV